MNFKINLKKSRIPTLLLFSSTIVIIMSTPCRAATDRCFQFYKDIDRPKVVHNNHLIAGIQETFDKGNGRGQGRVKLSEDQATKVYELAIFLNEDPLSLADRINWNLQITDRMLTVDQIIKEEKIQFMADNQMLPDGRSLGVREAVETIQEIIGDWDAGFSGILSLSRDQAMNIYELAISHKKDPLVLASEVRKKIQDAHRPNVKQIIKEMKLQFMADAQ